MLYLKILSKIKLKYKISISFIFFLDFSYINFNWLVCYVSFVFFIQCIEIYIFFFFNKLFFYIESSIHRYILKSIETTSIMDKPLNHFNHWNGIFRLLYVIRWCNVGSIANQKNYIYLKYFMYWQILVIFVSRIFRLFYCLEDNLIV